jgi:hypothetical protein
MRIWEDQRETKHQGRACPTVSTRPLRHFIVTYGPAGSGKGFVCERYEHTLRRLYPNTLPEKLREYKRMLFDGPPRPADPNTASLLAKSTTTSNTTIGTSKRPPR